MSNKVLQLAEEKKYLCMKIVYFITNKFLKKKLWQSQQVKGLLKKVQINAP